VISSDEESSKMKVETVKTALKANNTILIKQNVKTQNFPKINSPIKCELTETKRISKINQPYTPPPTPKMIRDTKKSAGSREFI